jgi:O-antigen ligase
MNFSKASGSYAAELATNVDKALFQYTFGGQGMKGLSHTHNTYINILAEGGVLSAIPYFLLYVCPLWKGFKLNRKCQGKHEDELNLINLINCGILGFMVAAFFANLILIDYVYWSLTLSYFLSQRLEAKLDAASRLARADLESAVLP